MMLSINYPGFPRNRADGMPTLGFKEDAVDEVLLLTDERRNQMDHLLDNYPSWFMDPLAQDNFARTITDNPLVMKLSYTDNLELIFQEAPITFQTMLAGTLRATELWCRNTKDKYSLPPTDPDQLAQVMEDINRRQTLNAFLHSVSTCQAALYDKMKRQLNEKWKADMAENPMDEPLMKSHSGIKYAYSPMQQRAWSADYSRGFQDRSAQLDALLLAMHTFKQQCVDLKAARAASAASGLMAAALGPAAPAAPGPGVAPAAPRPTADPAFVLARGIATERRTPPKAMTLQMSDSELRFAMSVAKNWFTDTNSGALTTTGQHQAASELFDKQFWSKICNKNRNECKMQSATGIVTDSELILTLDKALRLASHIWNEHNAKASAAVSVCNFFNGYLLPMLSGKNPLSTVAQQRDTYSTISDAYLNMTGEVFGNHNRFTGCLMLAAMSPDWREKILKEMHKTTEDARPMDGIYDPHVGLKTPVLATFDTVWSKEERMESEKNALAPKKDHKMESNVTNVQALHMETDNTCCLGQTQNQGQRPRSATPNGAKAGRSASGGRGRNEGKPRVHQGRIRWCTRCGHESHRVANCTVDRSSVHCSSCDVDGHVDACCGTRLAEKNPDLVNPPPGWVDRQPQRSPQQGSQPSFQQDRQPNPNAYMAQQARTPPPARRGRSPGRRSNSPRFMSPGGRTKLRRATPSPQRQYTAYYANPDQQQQPPQQQHYEEVPPPLPKPLRSAPSPPHSSTQPTSPTPPSILPPQTPSFPPSPSAAGRRTLEVSQ